MDRAIRKTPNAPSVSRPTRSVAISLRAQRDGVSFGLEKKNTPDREEGRVFLKLRIFYSIVIKHG